MADLKRIYDDRAVARKLFETTQFKIRDHIDNGGEIEVDLIPDEMGGGEFKVTITTHRLDANLVSQILEAGINRQ